MKTTNKVILSSEHISQFLDFAFKTHGLTIGEYFPQISVDKSFFILAATGLGKTVALPIYLLYLLVKKLETTSKTISIMPVIWVVMPKITIAEDEANHLNHLYAQFLQSLLTEIDPKKPILKSAKKNRENKVLFGYRTSKETKYTDAPIQFITTGILPLLAQHDNLDPQLNRIIIDEAHVTLEETEDMEIGITKLKKQGVVVNYMSATVEINDLEQRLGTTIIKADKARYKNFYHNTGKPLLDCIEDIITKTLINFDTKSEYYPAIVGNTTVDQQWKLDVITGTSCFDLNQDKPTRSSGLLIAINSQQGEKSDSKEVEKKIHSLCKKYGIEILTFSSKINKDPKLKKLFDRAFDRIKKLNLKYIIISTSVVEMGITWETLDYVVTMDSEYETVNLDGYQVLLTVPLGTNALKQRIGRVGRKRAGCGYITKEFGTEYTDMTDEELNGAGLKNQPISFPLSRVSPAKLAWWIAVENLEADDWRNAPFEEKYDYIKAGLASMKFPSLYKEADLCNVSGMTVDMIDLYVKLGVSDPANSEAVKLSQRWVGTPGYAFVLKGWEWIVKYRGTWEYNRKYYEVFLVYNYIATLLNYPITSLLGVDPVTGDPMKTTDFAVSPRMINNSDLMRMGFEISIVSDVVKQGWSTWDNLKGFDGDIVTIKRGLNPVNARKFAYTVYPNFTEILKVYVKNDGEELDPWFFAAFENGYKDIEDDHEGMEFKASWAFSNVKSADKYYNLYPIVYQEILNIYKVIGVSSKLKKLDDVTYQYTVIYDSQTVTGTLYQKNHFCKLDQEHVFWGLMTPSVTKDREDKTIQDIDFKFSWLLREDTNFFV